MKKLDFIKILAKSFLILLIIFFQTMLLFAFLLKSLAMFIAIMVIFNAICYVIYYCCDLNININEKKDLDN